MAETTHTRSEAEILRIVENGMNVLTEHDKESNYCVGAAWATLNLILRALGEKERTPPWSALALTDDVVTGESK